MKILITTILILFCFNANAKDYKTSQGYKKEPIPYPKADQGRILERVFIINDMKFTYKELYNTYYKWKATAKKNEIIFFPGKTVFCKTKEGYIKSYKYRVSNNFEIKRYILQNMGCEIMNKGNATLVEQEEHSTIVKLIFEAARADRLQVGFFDSRDLMTVEQFEQRASIK